ncbi:type II toxin-antitoxin system RelE/ParE family toxin [uncultured Corynebacterium sp.]|uniref:type II toxin-antitoxin system RelE/ParE family toxin n=1 Tax=uncultured Corynebacterium sp. TaxID=159447 RepID=UPI002803BF57|nr:type II toxin-antitoxin system RelE/ParE family toxin [uncultured Corynebacterium sp.]
MTDLGLSGVDFIDRAVGTDSKSRSPHYPRLPRKSVPVYPHEMSLKPAWVKGYYAIRVNSQWRIIFKWTPEGAVDVDFIDYH